LFYAKKLTVGLESRRPKQSAEEVFSFVPPSGVQELIYKVIKLKPSLLLLFVVYIMVYMCQKLWKIIMFGQFNQFSQAKM